MNRKRITLEVSREWVLDCREMGEMPIQGFIDRVRNCFEKQCEITIEFKNFQECTLLLTFMKDQPPDGSDEQIKKCIEELINLSEEDENYRKVLNFKIESINNKEKEDKEKNQFSNNLPVGQLSSEAPQKISNITSTLIGISKFKDLIAEIIETAPVFRLNKLESVFLSTNYLFSINKGYGLTTCLNALADVVRDCGFLGLENDHRKKVAEIVLDDQAGESIEKQIRAEVPTGFRGIICLDCSNIFISRENLFVKEILQYVNKNNQNAVFVFRVSYVEQSRLQEIEDILNDILNVRSLTFIPATNDELFAYAKQCFGNMGCTLKDKDLADAFKRLLAIEKRDGRFYGFQTVKKLVDEIIYTKVLKNKCSTVESIRTVDVLRLIQEDEGYEEELTLDDLVGMDTIKETTNEIITSIKFQKQRSEKNHNFKPPCLHMLFTGNPGCGKTTVARIIGRLLKDEGILSVGNFYEISGRDLVGRYIGETTPKTSQICRDAYGSVLFIDEAYTLAADNEDYRDYGREALATLIAEMENNRENLVVILAGYEDDMQRLLETNVGLKDRIPHTLHFPNYSRKDLLEIFLTMVEKSFRYDADFKKRAEQFFDNIDDEHYKSKMFSNGRMVRNLFERVWSKASVRFQMSGEPECNILKAVDLENAIDDSDFSTLLLKNTKMRKMGF